MDMLNYQYNSIIFLTAYELVLFCFLILKLSLKNFFLRENFFPREIYSSHENFFPMQTFPQENLFTP